MILKAFNAFQITLCFAAAPFILGWLSEAQFPAASVAFWVGVCAYVVGFFLMCGAVFIAIEDGR